MTPRISRTHATAHPTASLASPQMEVLKRGGVLFTAKSGHRIQFGSPAETSKDTFGRTPNLFVVDTKHAIDPHTGRTHEYEFPMYFGHYVVNKMAAPVHYAVRPEDVQYLERVLRTSFEGPQWDGFSNDEIALEYPQGKNTIGFPNLTSEMKYFRQDGAIDKLRQIHPIAPEGLVLGSARLFALDPGVYRILDGGILLGDVDLASFAFPNLSKGRSLITSNPLFVANRTQVMFQNQPKVIPIHASTGFDPAGGTSSLMIWNRGRVVLVDPPSDILDFLINHRIPLELVDGVILTHVHGDHDSGTLQILASCDRCKLYTTQSIRRMYFEKLTALSGGRIRAEDIESTHEFVPLKMLDNIVINGLTMNFVHGWHSIPAFGFEIQNRSGEAVFSFSGDTRNVTEVYELIKCGIISSPHRARDILDRPMRGFENGYTSAHEVGAQPLHTPKSRLIDEQLYLPRGGRLLAYHDSMTGIESSGLAALGDGTAFLNAQDLQGIHAAPPVFEEQIKSFLKLSPLFEGISEAHLDELVNLRSSKHLDLIEPGSKLMSIGEAGNTLHLLIDGKLEIRFDGNESEFHKGNDNTSTITSGLVGEGAIFGDKRNATLAAVEPSLLCTWVVTPELVSLLQASSLLERLQKLRSMRAAYFALLSQSTTFQDLSKLVIDGLLLTSEEVTLKKGALLFDQNAPYDGIYIVASGSITVSRDDVPLGTVTSGSVLGEMALLTGKPRNAKATAESDTRLLHFPKNSFGELMHRYPSLRLRLINLADNRLDPENLPPEINN